MRSLFIGIYDSLKGIVSIKSNYDNTSTVTLFENLVTIPKVTPEEIMVSLNPTIIHPLFAIKLQLHATESYLQTLDDTLFLQKLNNDSEIDKIFNNGHINGTYDHNSNLRITNIATWHTEPGKLRLWMNIGYISSDENLDAYDDRIVQARVDFFVPEYMLSITDEVQMFNAYSKWKKEMIEEKKNYRIKQLEKQLETINTKLKEIKEI